MVVVLVFACELGQNISVCLLSVKKDCEMRMMVNVVCVCVCVCVRACVRA